MHFTVVTIYNFSLNNNIFRYSVAKYGGWSSYWTAQLCGTGNEVNLEAIPVQSTVTI